MARSEYRDLDTDVTLGGSGASDIYAPSQKAVKTYVDNNSGSSTLAGLTDTTVTTPSNGQALIYNSTSSKWENTTTYAMVIVDYTS